MLLLLAACGDLPQPFRGSPGATARRLSQPPPPRLVVASPDGALLDAQGAADLTAALASALADAEVPAVVAQAKPGEWRLIVSAELRGRDVVPAYAVLDPAGEPKGTTEGPPVAAPRWAEARPDTMRAAALAATPSVSSLLTRIEAARRQSDPNSLLNRPAKIHLAGVTGAPGDGNRSLPAQMQLKLSSFGLVVQDTAAGADFGLAGTVESIPASRGLVQVAIQWIVTDAGGTERGRILQVNDIPPAVISRYWGDVAVVVAEEAAGGVRDVVLTQAGARKPGG